MTIDKFDTGDFEDDKEFLTEEELEELRVSEEKELKEKEITLPHEVKLKYPVQFGKDLRDIIIVKRRLKTKDLMNFPAEGQKFGHIVSLVSKITQEPMSLIKELDSKDLVVLSKIVQNFL